MKKFRVIFVKLNCRGVNLFEEFKLMDLRVCVVNTDFMRLFVLLLLSILYYYGKYATLALGKYLRLDTNNG